jgi:uncharacterized protein DUF2459
MRICGLLLLVAVAQSAYADERAPHTLYVVRRGWHVDVGYAVQDLREPLRSITKNFPGVNYVLFGFGDKHYLDDVKNQHGPKMLAALWPGRGIILVTTLQSPPDAAFEDGQVIALSVTERELRDSQNYVWKSLVTESNEANVYQPGPYAGGYYFLAIPKYSAFHTCNTWAAQTLRAAGFPIRAQGVLFARQLWSQVRRLRSRAEAGGSGKIASAQ